MKALLTEDRILPFRDSETEPLLEVVLHTDAQLAAERIIEAFEAYAIGIGLKPDLDKRFQVGGLCFLPLRASPDLLPSLGEFSFLRIARAMPRLRKLRPLLRQVTRKTFGCELPEGGPVDPQIRAAGSTGCKPAGGAKVQPVLL